MKKQLERCMYMGIGAFITLISWTLAEMHNASVNAQNAGPLVVDEIICRKLQVVDKQGNKKVVLSTASGGGTVVVCDKKRKGVVHLSANESGGFVNVHSTDSRGRAILGTDLSGGKVVIYNLYGQQIGEFSVDFPEDAQIETRDGQIKTKYGQIKIEEDW